MEKVTEIIVLTAAFLASLLGKALFFIGPAIFLLLLLHILKKVNLPSFIVVILLIMLIIFGIIISLIIFFALSGFDTAA